MRAYEFWCVLNGEPCELPNGEKCRYPVADALEVRAKIRRAEGRKEVAARLSWAVGAIRSGNLLTKALQGRLRADIAVVRQQLVTDGVESETEKS